MNFSKIVSEFRNHLQKESDSLALKVKQDGTAKDYNDCVPIVAAGVAAAGTKLGSVGGTVGACVGAAIGTGGGIHMAQISCRHWFPEGE